MVGLLEEVVGAGSRMLQQPRDVLVRQVRLPNCVVISLLSVPATKPEMATRLVRLRKPWYCTSEQTRVRIQAKNLQQE